MNAEAARAGQTATEHPNEEVKARLSIERRARIVELVAKQGAVHVNQLSQSFGVSKVTIRNDLDILARQGLLIRDRGGAVPGARSNLATVFEQRVQLHVDEKRRIGRAAAQLVRPGETIIMDAGTTLMEMARQLDSIGPLTVVTTALNVAGQVGVSAGVEVVIIGGSLSRATVSTHGPLAEGDLSNIVAHKLFLGTHALVPEAGAVDVSIELASVKRAMIRAAREVILLADSSKWSRSNDQAFAKVVALSDIGMLISDTNLPDDARAELDRNGVTTILV